MKMSIRILRLVAAVFVLLSVSRSGAHAEEVIDIGSETARAGWCSEIREKYSGNISKVVSSANILLYLQGSERTQFLNFCSSTPGSLQHTNLKAAMADNAADAIFDHPMHEIEKWCITTRERYGVEPGQSFGSMPTEMHAHYLKAKCYRFFCQHDPRAGNGKFNCIPLEPATETETEAGRARQRG